MRAKRNVEVWAEWNDGRRERMDKAPSESEAVYLVREYQLTFKDSVRRIWIQENDD